MQFVSTLSKGRNFTINSTLLPFLATKSSVASTESKVASTLLLVWTGLKGRCTLSVCKARRHDLWMNTGVILDTADEMARVHG